MWPQAKSVFSSPPAAATRPYRRNDAGTDEPDAGNLPGTPAKHTRGRPAHVQTIGGAAPVANCDGAALESVHAHGDPDPVPAVRRPDGPQGPRPRRSVAPPAVLGMPDLRTALLDNLPAPEETRTRPGRRRKQAQRPSQPTGGHVRQYRTTVSSRQVADMAVRLPRRWLGWLTSNRYFSRLCDFGPVSSESEPCGSDACLSRSRQGRASVAQPTGGSHANRHNRASVD